MAFEIMSIDTACVGAAAIVGALLRVSLLALFDVPFAPVHAILAPNAIGSLIMGAAVAKKSRLVKYCSTMETTHSKASIACIARFHRPHDNFPVPRFNVNSKPCRRTCFRPSRPAFAGR